MSKPASAGPASRPLSGVRVLDLSRLLPGPFCTLILSDLGRKSIRSKTRTSGTICGCFHRRSRWG